MKKKIIYISIFFLILFLVIKNYRILADSVPENIKKKIPMSLVNLHLEIESYINLLGNKNFLYNVKFLPDTILVNKTGRVELELKEVKTNVESFNKSSFFIDFYDKYIFLSSSNSNLFYLPKDKLKANTSSVEPIKINSNLNEYTNVVILDSFIDGDNYYLSTFESRGKNKNCNFRLLTAKINLNDLIFDELFINPGCTDSRILGGRMQKFTNNNVNGILFSLAEQSSDRIHFKAQDDSSYVGKINFLDLQNNQVEVYSKGHRNPQGLYVKDDLILSTEHGPMGGDEINKIVNGGNYGWPIASYGKYYFSKNKSYLYSHSSNNFVEPIFSYFTAIGISEIVNVPEKFLKIQDLKNIFFISSLAGNSLHLVKFDQNYNRVIFTEKIFIKREIRDLKYLEEENFFILALQNPTKIGVFRVK